MKKESSLIKPSAINEKRLDPNQYCLSLLQEALRLGLVDHNTVDNFQNELIVLLKEVIIKYTQGDSTSVRVEKAQSILLSILYTIDAITTTFDTPEDSLAFIQANNVKEIYNIGLASLHTCLAETKVLYQKILNCKMDVQIKAYYSTIDEALPDFLSKYDISFQAHDTMASMDYPLLFDNMNIQGILYIKQYLEKLDIETRFYRFFDKNEVNSLLLGFGRVNRIDYREALINVFEILLTNAIFSTMCGNEASQIIITTSQFKLLCQQLDVMDHSQCVSCIRSAIKMLLKRLEINDAGLKEYIWNFQPLLIPRFLSALDNNHLDNLIIVEKQENNAIEIIFDEGKSMTNEIFCDMVEKILECTHSQEKNSIISSSIHSLGDFIDMLEADCLFDEEYISLYASLGDIELSVLARIVFIEELRNEPRSFSFDAVIDTVVEMPWQIEYINFLKSLSDDRIVSIEKCINSSLIINSD